MIVGNGMIAKAFYNRKIDTDVTIFASGVSNSQETRESEFDREFSLLQTEVSKDNHIVYFSTTSVYDESLKDTHYVLHKKKIEAYIQDNSKSYNIFRLPIVVGNTDNDLTLIKFLYKKIVSGENINIFVRACRYLLDVEDLSYLVSKILELGLFKNDIINFCISPSSPILDIINSLEQVTKTEVKKTIIDKGGCYQVDSEEILKFIEQIDYKVSHNYSFDTIKKYYGK